MSTKINWDEYARLYDRLNILIPYQEYKIAIVDAAKIQSEDTVFEAGCGTGNITYLIAAQKPNRVIAVDFSEHMLQHAQEKDFEEVSFAQCDLNQTLPYGDESFSVVISGNVLYALTDPAKTLTELYRILRPGGRIVIATPKKGFDNGLILKSHAGEESSDSFWENATGNSERELEIITRATTDPVIQADFVKLANYNSTIVQSVPKLFTATEIKEQLQLTGFTDVRITDTYAKQNLLCVAKKG